MSQRIVLAHGAGGAKTEELIKEVFLEAFGNPILEELSDQATVELEKKRVSVTTDSYVVSPLFFPGGDIGKLAVYGTVNDLSVGGATPLYMSASFIIEEGTEVSLLKRIAESMKDALTECDTTIVTADTKVVEKGKADTLFINTTGVGVVDDHIELSATNIEEGDVVILSGTIAEHGAVILARRADIDVSFGSDCAPLCGLTSAMLTAGGVKLMRDVTRGGLATILNEFADASGKGIVIEEARIPIKEEVKGVCEILGVDPLYLACEGKLVAIVSPKAADRVLASMKAHPLGREATVVGTVTESRRGVVLRTTIGVERMVGKLSGENLPRIC